MNWPQALALWSGFYASTLATCAFAMSSRWSSNMVEPFGNILFACTVSLLTGCTVGRRLACKRPHMAQLTRILSLASAFALAPILLDDIARLNGSSPVEETRTALLITGGLFIPPLTLLCMVPAYAGSIITRNRINGSSGNGAVIFWAALGFATGGLLNAHLQKEC